MKRPHSPDFSEHDIQKQRKLSQTSNELKTIKKNKEPVKQAKNKTQVYDFLDKNEFFHTKLSVIQIDDFDELPEWFGDINPDKTLRRLLFIDVPKIPDSIQKLDSITELYIQNASYVPNLIHFLNITSLTLDNCNLTKIPENIFSLLSLQKLQLNNNQITEIPNTIYLLLHLSNIDFRYNMIEKIPNMAHFNYLLYLNMGHNKLKEVEIRNDTLEKLWLDNNQINSLSFRLHTPKLIDLFLSHNNLNTFPRSVKNCTNLEVLNLSVNMIRVIDSIENLDNLKELYISNNKLKVLSHSITQLENLEFLEADHNEIIDIPVDFENLKNLETLSLIDNKLTKIPDSLAKLPQILQIYLQMNQIRHIPESLAKIMKKKPNLIVELDDNPIEEMQLSFPNVKSLLKSLYQVTDPLYPQIDFVRNLDEASLNILREYTQAYTIENRNKQKDKFILNLFEQVPPLAQPLKVYRGVTKFPFQSNRQFISTSLYKDTAYSFLEDYKCCLLIITLQAGTKILPLKEISTHENENEILLNGNGIFEITQQREIHKIPSQIIKSTRYPFSSINEELAKSIGIKLPKNATVEESIKIINDSQKLNLKTYYLTYNYMGKINSVKEMRIITFNLGTNIQSGIAEGTEKLFVEFCKNTTIPHNKYDLSACSTNAIQWLVAQKAELIGLQEVNPKYLVTILSYWPLKYKYIGHRNSICFIYNEEMLGEGQLLSDTNLFFENEYRPMIMVYFPKVKLMAVNLHAEHNIPLKSEIEEKYNTVIENYDQVIDRVVVLGDFNDQNQKLKSLFLSQLSLKQHANIIPTCCADSNYQYYGDYIFDSDYNLVGRYGTPPEALHSVALKNEKLVRVNNNPLMSDHDPVVFYPGLN